MSAVFDEFFKWVGISVTQWAHVEDYLYMTCQKCLRTPRYDLASIVYYRTSSLDGRLTLVTELLRANLPERRPRKGGHDHPDLVQWNDIRKELQRLLATRRRIAHHPMRSNLDYETQDGFRIHIETSFAEELRGQGDPLPPLEQSDLEKHVIDVQAAIKRLKEFHDVTLPKHTG